MIDQKRLAQTAATTNQSKYVVFHEPIMTWFLPVFPRLSPVTCSCLKSDWFISSLQIVKYNNYATRSIKANEYMKYHRFEVQRKI